MAFASTVSGTVIFFLALAASSVTPAAAARRLGAMHMHAMFLLECVRVNVQDPDAEDKRCFAHMRDAVCGEAHHLEANHL